MWSRDDGVDPRDDRKTSASDPVTIKTSSGNFQKPPFVLSKLFTHRLKGGIEKQGSGVEGWLLPLQLWGKVGMGVSPNASPPSPPSLQDAHSPAWECRSASAAYTPRNPCLTPVAGGRSQPIDL